MVLESVKLGFTTPPIMKKEIAIKIKHEIINIFGYFTNIPTAIADNT